MTKQNYGRQKGSASPARISVAAQATTRAMRVASAMRPEVSETRLDRRARLRDLINEGRR